ncbi:hypothetical protein [Stenotrophomonas maltophilia]|nr:hypothetical protein [Stenotrophomonas maltophilia]
MSQERNAQGMPRCFEVAVVHLKCVLAGMEAIEDFRDLGNLGR